MASQSREGALAGTLFALVAQLTTAVFTAGTTLYLVRALGPAGYGELTLVLSVAGLALVLADGAVAQSTGRYVAPVAEDPARAVDVVSAGLRLKLWLSAGAGLALVLLAGPIAGAYGAEAMTLPLRLAAVAVVAESLFMLWLVAFQSLRRLSYNVRLYFVESVAEASAVVGLVVLGAGVSGAVLGRAVGYGVGALAGGVMLGRLLGRRIDPRGGDRATRRQIGGYSVPLFVNTSAYTAYSQVDVQLVGALLDRVSVGVFAAPLKLLTLLSYPGQALANAVSPRMAGPSPDVRAFTSGMRAVLLYQAALVPPVVLWAGPVCRLVLGPGFEDSAPVLASTAPYLYLRGVSVLASTTVNYLGHARRRIPVVLMALGVNLGLGVVLVPRVGVVGAALALGASYALYVPLHLRLCAQSFALPVRSLTNTVLRSAAAAAVMAGVLLLVGIHDLSAAQWLLGGPAALAAYVLVLIATGEVSGEDFARLRRLSRRRRPGAVAAPDPGRVSGQR